MHKNDIKAGIILVIALIIFSNGKLLSSDSIRTGDKAILFQISEGSLHPKSFMGGLGYQVYIGKALLLRLPVGIGYSYKLDEKPKNAETDYTEESWRFRVTPGLRYNFGRGHNVIVYTGVQLLFDYEYGTIKGKDYKINEENTSKYTYGLGGMLGAEWFPWKSLSFSLEYSPFLSITGGKTVYASGGFSQTEKTPSEINIQSNLSSALFIISFYFN